MTKKKKIVFSIIAALSVAVVTAAVLLPLHFLTIQYPDPSEGFKLPVTYLEDFGRRIVIENTGNYLAHPDLEANSAGDILVMYPQGHGKGAITTRISSDYGENWNLKSDTPTSWQNSKETPTLYGLDFVDGEGKETGEKILIMISGCPKWPGQGIKADGFQFSLSVDDGATFSEFEHIYGRDWAKRNDKKTYDCIVAMSSLTRLKEDGKFVNKWMGTFHDHNFVNYKSILSFRTDENGSPILDESGFPIAEWSEPESLFPMWRSYEKRSDVCELEVIRTPEKLGGNTLIAIGRRNKHDGGSYILFSDDEGKNWTEPKALPLELTGDRHRAVYDPIGDKLVISFRHVCNGRAKSKIATFDSIVSLGWIGWVGTFEDLLLFRDSEPETIGERTIIFSGNYNGGADCGYSGATCRDGEFLLVSYGTFDESAKNPYIMAVKFRL